jgi:uncharacterized protein (DUF488 family)
MHTIYSIGHSVRPFADFLALLQAHGVRQLADIRSVPYSRRHPHFSEQELARSLAHNGIAYRHFPQLGGKRGMAQAGSLNQAFREGGGLQAYADHMATPEFASGLQLLVDWAASAPTAMMCAEAKPSECHRQLTADALVFAGLEVRHITGLEAPSLHVPHKHADLREGKLTYPARQGTLF